MSSRSKKYARELREEVARFRRVTGTTKVTVLTMVTTQGVKANEFSVELAQNSVRVDALFVRDGVHERLTAPTRVPKLGLFRHVRGSRDLLSYAGCDFVFGINARSRQR